MRIAVTSVADVCLVLSKPSIDLNEVRAVTQIFLDYGIEAEVLDRDHYDEANEYDVLFIKWGMVVNFGGEQSNDLKKAIAMINNFKGKVFMLSVDQDFVYSNTPRDGFDLITRPVYFLYTGTNHKEIANKALKGIEVIDTVQFNHCVQIGKELSKLEFLNVIPKYDAIYGGQARRELIPLINLIAKSHSIVTYWGMSKKAIGTVHLQNDKFFDNEEIRAINSLGKFSFIFNKPKTQWLTPRIFEQLDSNSLVLFDTKWEATKPFWTDKNTFSNKEELLERLEYEPTKKDIEEQHQLSLKFDYDDYNQEQISHILPLLE